MKSFDAVKTMRDIRIRIFVEDLKRKPVPKVTPQVTPQVTPEVTTEVKRLLHVEIGDHSQMELQEILRLKTLSISV